MSRLPEFHPEPGGNRIGTLRPTKNQETSYASLDALQEALAELVSKLSSLEQDLELEMLNYALPVDSTSEIRLRSAHIAEWPSSLGEPPTQIKYRYYKTLKQRNSTTAAYLRRRYEEAARDVTGTAALDLLDIARLTKQEAFLIRDFLGTYLDTTTDSSEQRVIEVFQDWVYPTLVYTDELRSYLQAGVSTSSILTDTEIRSLPRQDARQAQAVFKVKLNEANNQIIKNLDYLRRNFSEFAPVFYDRYLGPALGFRLQVGRKSTPSNPDRKLFEQVKVSSAHLEGSLRSALVDQTRRRTLYHNKTEEIFRTIKRRDAYRALIHQLAPKGKPVPMGGPRTMVEPSPEIPDDIPDPVPETVESTQPLAEPEPEPVAVGVSQSLFLPGTLRETRITELLVPEDASLVSVEVYLGSAPVGVSSSNCFSFQVQDSSGAALLDLKVDDTIKYYSSTELELDVETETYFLDLVKVGTPPVDPGGDANVLLIWK